jgi:hypothetical protein
VCATELTTGDEIARFATALANELGARAATEPELAEATR